MWKSNLRDIGRVEPSLQTVCKQGNLKEAFNILKTKDETSLSIDEVASLLLACDASKSLQPGTQLHAKAIKAGMNTDTYLGAQLLSMYGNTGNLKSACLAFQEIIQRNYLVWNNLIKSYMNNKGSYEEPIKMYHRMRIEGTKPDKFTYPLVIRACNCLNDLTQGMKIHTNAVKEGFTGDRFVGATLIDMYCKCGMVFMAERVFHDIPSKDSVIFNSLLSGYCKFGNLEFARQLFDEMPTRTAVSWTTIIGGYVESGLFKHAIELFDEMVQCGFKPSGSTYVCVLPACGHLGALQKGIEIHEEIVKFGMDSDVFVANSLMNMYSKCGRIEIARELFDKLPKEEPGTWNAMIVGYGINGQGEKAIELFDSMVNSAIRPCKITYTSVLSACSHSGFVDKGIEIFNSLKCNKHEVEVSVEHYACIVDLLGRAGKLKEARDVIAEMPYDASASIWGALLSACKTHGNVELGELAARALFQIEPYNAGNYVLLSNIYADAGMWDDVEKVRIMLRGKGLRKQPGCSWIEIDKTVHAFIGGDRRHPKSNEIYGLLEELFKKMKMEGISTDTRFDLHDVVEEEKESALWCHSERLAVAFGIISTPPGTSIQIIKNLRACGDCHAVIKFISKYVQREIVVRDINRFHHFKDGACSCGDYW